MKIFFFTVFFLAGVLLRLHAITLDAGTPIFEQPDPQSPLIAMTDRPVECRENGPKQRVFISRHPLARYEDFLAVTLPDGRSGYAAPTIQPVPEPGGGWVFRSLGPPQRGRQILFLGIAAALVLLIIHYRKGCCNRTIVADSAEEDRCFALFLIFLRQLLILYVVMGAGNLVCSAADEPGYLQVGADLLRGEWDGPWNYPIGLGVLFYLPALLLTGADNYYDLAIGASLFSALVLAPLSLATGYAVLRALRIGSRAALAAGLMWAIMPFVLFYVPDWDNGVFSSAIGLPSFQMSFRHYNTLIGAGYNAMSDTLSTLLVLVTLLAALRLPDRLWSIAAVAALFGVCCLVRLNNVFFAPVIGFALFCRHREKIAAPRYLAQGLVIGSAVYLGVLLPQFLVNLHQFGSPFTFSYVLHYQGNAVGDRPMDGFTLHTLFKLSGIRFLGGSNFAVWCLGLTGLLFLKERRLRVALTLWAVPVIWFFFGYSHTFCDAVRFILSSYLPLFAAFTAAAVWHASSTRQRLAAAAAIGFTICCTVPTMIRQPWLAPWNWHLEPWGNNVIVLCCILAPLGLLAVAVWLYRRGERRHAAFLTVFGLLYFLATAEILAVLLLLVLLRALFDWGRMLPEKP